MRVLIAQEDPATSFAIAQRLMAEGFQADISPDGEDALHRAKEGEYCVIILDLLLPKLNGNDVCQSMRDGGVKTPIIIVTIKSGEYDEVESFEMGADDFLRRPLSFDVLTARLRALLRREPCAYSEKLVIGRLQYEPLSRNFFVDTRKIELTGREAAILEVLIRAQSKIVTKQRLLNLVWGIDFDGDPNIVNVYIGYLRRKLNKATARKLLKTVHGLGYQLVTE